MASSPFRSVAEMFLSRVAETPDAPAFSEPSGSDWKKWTWKETGEKVRLVASGLRAVGLADEERCAILAGTRLDWIFSDLGILCAGGATTTIYPSSTAEECAFIINDSATSFVIAENDDQVAKLQKVRATMPSVRLVISIDGKASDDGWVITFETLLAKGKVHAEQNAGEYERIARAVNKDALATLIYTSGTTGVPKGVELTHDCWLYESEALQETGMIHPDDVQYFWLPLAHSFGKVLEMGQVRIGFSTAVDGRIDKIVPNLAAVQPTFMCGVPRIFEKVHNKVVGTAKENGGMTYRMFQWATGVGKRYSKAQQAGESPGMMLGLQHAIANRLVFPKVQNLFGGKIKFFISGSAPLSLEMAEWFHAFGLLICEGYGLTETSAASFVNRPDKFKFRTVGVPLPGTEVRIAESDGEILIRGRGVMRGYHNLAEATAETLVDGWLHTGDIGELTPDGFLKITDRKKELIKTSGGKYVAPQMLEGRLKALCPYVSQVVIHGDNRNFCTALIALDGESITKWAKDNGLAGKSYADLSKEPAVKAMIQPFIDQLNADLPSYETVKKFALLPKDLTPEDGELTPSLKLKRKVVEKKYKDVLDAFYAGAMADK